MHPRHLSGMKINKSKCDYVKNSGNLVRKSEYQVIKVKQYLDEKEKDWKRREEERKEEKRKKEKGREGED